MSGYEKSSKDADFDSDGTPFARGTNVHPRGEQYSQEFRLSGELDRLHWLTGLYYINYDVGRFAAALFRDDVQHVAQTRPLRPEDQVMGRLRECRL